MNEVPPGPEEPDDVDGVYRRASALDSSRPNELVRRRILNHAAQLAAERAVERTPESDTAGTSRKRVANPPWRRPAIFGTLAAAALAGLLITPRFFAPHAPTTAATSSARVARPSSAIPAAPEQTEGRSAETAAGEQPHPPRAEGQGFLKPQAFARNAAPVTNSAADIAAKNASAKAQSKPNARSTAAARNSAVDSNSAAARDSVAARDSADAQTSRMQAMSGAQSAAPPAAPAPGLSDPAAELRRAAERGDIAKLQILLDEQNVADKQTLVDARDAGGRTALMLATLHGRAQAVDVLLAHGADPNAADSHGTTPLQAAIAGGQQSIAAALQRAGAR